MEENWDDEIENGTTSGPTIPFESLSINSRTPASKYFDDDFRNDAPPGGRGLRNDDRYGGTSQRSRGRGRGFGRYDLLLKNDMVKKKRRRDFYDKSILFLTSLIYIFIMN